MNRPEDQLATIVNGLQAQPPDATSVLLARQLLEQGKGAHVFNRLFKILAEENDHRVIATMLVLERVVELDAGVGAYLMARLYRIRTKVHHVPDSIELWMAHLRSVDAAALLETLAEELGPGGARDCRNWARNIRQNAGTQ